MWFFLKVGIIHTFTHEIYGASFIWRRTFAETLCGGVSMIYFLSISALLNANYAKNWRHTVGALVAGQAAFWILVNRYILYALPNQYAFAVPMLAMAFNLVFWTG